MTRHFLLLNTIISPNFAPSRGITRQGILINHETMLDKSCHTESKLYAHQQTGTPNGRRAMSSMLVQQSHSLDPAVPDQFLVCSAHGNPARRPVEKARYTRGSLWSPCHHHVADLRYMILLSSNTDQQLQFSTTEFYWLLQLLEDRICWMCNLAVWCTQAEAVDTEVWLRNQKLIQLSPTSCCRHWCILHRRSITNLLSWNISQ